MDDRTITISLDTARELYDEGGLARAIVLQFFTEKELMPHYENIMTFEDACQTLRLNMAKVNSRIKELNLYPWRRSGIAEYHLEVVKEALNKCWTPQLNDDKHYYAWLRWYPKDKTYPKDWQRIGEFLELFGPNKGTYTVVGNCMDIEKYHDDSLDYFSFGFGIECKSKEIAFHLLKYFGKTIFAAFHDGLYGLYDWID